MRYGAMCCGAMHFVLVSHFLCMLRPFAPTVTHYIPPCTSCVAMHGRFEPFLRQAVLRFAQEHQPEYVANQCRGKEFQAAFYNLPIIHK